MRTEILPDGNLLITADDETRACIVDAFERDGYQGAECEVIEHLRALDFEMIAPENIGALTDAPILCNDWNFPDNAPGYLPASPDSPVWSFPDYMVRDPWRELADTGRVVFTLAKD